MIETLQRFLYKLSYINIFILLHLKEFPSFCFLFVFLGGFHNDRTFFFFSGDCILNIVVTKFYVTMFVGDQLFIPLNSQF